ncbi:MAG: serine/threonine protein kinase [Ktedonobacteraceae bacterium]|nr:serine/threonine protein kinase [Ktedonobacteraceae bacterium]
MIDVKAYDISFSEDQLETFLAQLLGVLQSETSQPEIKVPRSLLKVLVIDVDKLRAGAVAQLINATGYQSIIAVNTLDGFTLFLRGSYIPQAIILGSDYIAEPHFLRRLLQQTMQKYQLRVPLFRLAPPPQPITPYVSRRTSQPLQELSSAKRPQQTGNIEQVGREKLLLTGQSLGRYQIQTVLGGGLQGSVYQAYDRLREQEVALKAMQVSMMPYAVIRTSEEDANLFQQELDLLSKLEHPHIQIPSNAGRSYISGVPFVFKTMPYYPERSLALWLSRHVQKTFSHLEIAPLVMQLAGALQCAHDHQILYQNFKLSNLLIRNQPNNIRHLHLLLSDFPVAQDGSFFSKTFEAFPYMAPERWEGRALPASDQYGLAAIVYELLAGRPPFQGGSEYTMRFLHLNMQPQMPSVFSPNLPPAVNHVILRGLAKRPEDRFPSVAVFAKTLQRYCS